MGETCWHCKSFLVSINKSLGICAITGVETDVDYPACDKITSIMESGPRVEDAEDEKQE